MNRKSLGIIETRGYVAAVEAADAGMKAANVVFLGYEVILTGLVTIKFAGDVAAVKTAVAAGVAAAGKIGRVMAHHVIPRPDDQIPMGPDGPSPETLPPAEAKPQKLAVKKTVELKPAVISKPAPVQKDKTAVKAQATLSNLKTGEKKTTTRQSPARKKRPAPKKPIKKSATKAAPKAKSKPKTSKE